MVKNRKLLSGIQILLKWVNNCKSHSYRIRSAVGVINGMPNCPRDVWVAVFWSSWVSIC